VADCQHQGKRPGRFSTGSTPYSNRTFPRGGLKHQRTRTCLRVRPTTLFLPGTWSRIAFSSLRLMPVLCRGRGAGAPLAQASHERATDHGGLWLSGHRPAWAGHFSAFPPKCHYSSRLGLVRKRHWLERRKFSLATDAMMTIPPRFAFAMD
jgi:hypothetical protein